MRTACFSAILESFFTERLMRQRQASPHTISSYRDIPSGCSFNMRRGVCISHHHVSLLKT